MAQLVDNADVEVSVHGAETKLGLTRDMGTSVIRGSTNALPLGDDFGLPMSTSATSAAQFKHSVAFADQETLKPVNRAASVSSYGGGVGGVPRHRYGGLRVTETQVKLGGGPVRSGRSTNSTSSTIGGGSSIPVKLIENVAYVDHCPGIALLMSACP